MTSMGIQSDSMMITAIGHISADTGTLNKTVKTTERAVSLAQIVAKLVPGGEGVASGLGLLAGQLKTTKSVISATNVLERFCDWGTEKTRNAVLKHGIKTAKLVALTAAQVLETVLFVDKCSVSYFFQASLTVCTLPILGVVKGCLYMTSAVFGLWYSSQEVSKALSTTKNAKIKKCKWEQLYLDEKSKQKLQAKYKDKLNDQRIDSEKLRGEIVQLRTVVKNIKWQEVSSKEVEKIRNELTAKKTQLAPFSKIKNYLKAVNDGRLETLQQYKIEKYEVRLANQKKILEKCWLGIVVDIAKIVSISLGMFVAAMSVTYPVFTLPAAVLFMTALGMVSSGLGLGKNIYGVLASKIEKEPVFSLQERSAAATA